VDACAFRLPQSGDFVFELQLASLQFVDFQVIGAWVAHHVVDLSFD
jgi:hypothetical protein